MGDISDENVSKQQKTNYCIIYFFFLLIQNWRDKKKIVCFESINFIYYFNKILNFEYPHAPKVFQQIIMKKSIEIL